MRLVEAIWRMERADRMQEGYAVRQAQEVTQGRENRLHAQDGAESDGGECAVACPNLTTSRKISNLSLFT